MALSKKGIVVLLCAILGQSPLPVAAAILVQDITCLELNFRSFNTTANTPLDLNQDGTADVTFSEDNFSTALVTDNTERVRFVIARSPPPNIAGPVAALPVKYRIGPELQDNTYSVGATLGAFLFQHELFVGGARPIVGEPETFVNQLMICLVQGCAGWFRGQDSYVGFSFEEEDGVHYGYIEIAGNDIDQQGFPFGGQLVRIAYETEPGRSIVTGAIPEPSSSLLVCLAVAVTLGIRRKEQNSTKDKGRKHA